MIQHQTINRKLAVAAEVLGAENHPLPQRVEQAANTLWSAMFDRDHWPPRLLEQADHIMEDILIDGPVEYSVRAMDEATLDGTAEAIANLLAKSQAALSVTPPAPRRPESAASAYNGHI